MSVSSADSGHMEARLHKAVPVFAALGDAVRLRLVNRLSSEGPASIVQLSRGSGLTRQAITKHLHVLGNAGLVHNARRGRESSWTLDPEPLQAASTSLDEISAQWDRALNRLKAFVGQ
jgi:DNA-binding transcriptional ArsR family regulator